MTLNNFNSELLSSLSLSILAGIEDDGCSWVEIAFCSSINFLKNSSFYSILQHDD